MRNSDKDKIKILEQQVEMLEKMYARDIDKAVSKSAKAKRKKDDARKRHV